MEVHFCADIQARLERLANETGCTQDQFVQNAMPGYLDEMERTRQMLDSGYDEIKSGRVMALDGEEAKQRRVSGCRLHPEVFADLDEIWEFIAQNSLDAADRVREEIHPSILNLIGFAHQGHWRLDLTISRNPRVMAAILRGRE